MEYSGDPYLAPVANAQVIAQETDAGFRLIVSKTLHGYYCWDDGWRLTDEAGFWDYMLLIPGPKKVLFGRTIRDGDFHRIVSKAHSKGLG